MKDISIQCDGFTIKKELWEKKQQAGAATPSKAVANLRKKVTNWTKRMDYGVHRSKELTSTSRAQLRCIIDHASNIPMQWRLPWRNSKEVLQHFQKLNLSLSSSQWHTFKKMCFLRSKATYIGCSNEETKESWALCLNISTSTIRDMCVMEDDVIPGWMKWNQSFIQIAFYVMFSL